MLTLSKATETFPLIAANNAANGFTYRNVEFSQNSFNMFIGLNAVDSPQNVKLTLQTLQQLNINCTRMGAYKPRTQPYSFQGHGAKCLSYVFEYAGQYNIAIIAMEVTAATQIEEINSALQAAGNPTGVMLQVGTRNAQNFELLKELGQQQQFPILYKRGYGISLYESLAACEYLAHSGNNKIIFCLRGVKSLHADPHRNLVDFAHVSSIKRLTNLSVCVDPSHAVGNLLKDPHGIPEIFHASSQGVIAGANMLLVDAHPNPQTSLVDAQQAISLQDLPWFIEDMQITRSAYLRRHELLEQKVS